MSSSKDLLRRLVPDIPRFVEVHDLLELPTTVLASDDLATAERSAPRPTSRATEAGQGLPSFAIWEHDEGLGAIVGRPSDEIVRRAAEASEELVALVDNHQAVAATLPSWTVDHATVHTLAGLPHEGPPHPTRLLDPAELSAWQVPDDLLEELADPAEAGRPIVAALDGDRPVAFAYPASFSPGHWDMSIDTLESHRRRGFAWAASVGLIRHLAPRGLLPVWGSADSNPASFHLAAKIGYTPADELWVFTAPDA